MVVDDVVINKCSAIERCLKRIKEVCRSDPRSILNDQTALESVILNIQRSCEVTIDLAMHATRVRRLGVPQTSRDAFELLADAEIINRELLARMKAMVGFRNIAIHEYQKIDPEVVVSIVINRLSDFEQLIQAIKKI